MAPGNHLRAYPLWFDAVASFSLLIGVWLGVLVFEMGLPVLSKVPQGNDL